MFCQQGKPTESGQEQKVLQYGEKNTQDFIAGAEALPDTEEKERSKDQDGWESCSDEEDDDSDGEWVDVHHSSDEEQVC